MKEYKIIFLHHLPPHTREAARKINIEREKDCVLNGNIDQRVDERGRKCSTEVLYEQLVLLPGKFFCEDKMSANGWFYIVEGATIEDWAWLINKYNLMDEYITAELFPDLFGE